MLHDGHRQPHALHHPIEPVYYTHEQHGIPGQQHALPHQIVQFQYALGQPHALPHPIKPVYHANEQHGIPGQQHALLHQIVQF